MIDKKQNKEIINNFQKNLEKLGGIEDTIERIFLKNIDLIADFLIKILIKQRLSTNIKKRNKRFSK